MPVPSPSKLPRWRGFNLLEKFIARTEDWNRPFLEFDFETMAEWGFNFARLPMSYRCWSSPENWREIDENAVKDIDQAVEWGRQYGIHVSLNFHRAPGYSVDRGEEEPFNLWKDAEALEACSYHWSYFADRYKGIPNTQLSIDLVNEPAVADWETGEQLDDATYFKTAKALVEAIRAQDPDRLIIADGLNYGRIPVPMLAELNVAQSSRGYEPFPLTHWKAHWVDGSDQWPQPDWPFTSESYTQWVSGDAPKRLRQTYPDNEIIQQFPDLGSSPHWDKDRIRELMIAPWKKLEAMGSGVHVGECGCYNKTPHDAFIPWLEDMLALWKEAGWGYSIWNLRGDFGVLDSGRSDMKYEDFRGHKLDRKMLETLQADA